MRKRSIGVRLAAWYFVVFACGIAAFCIVAWFAMRASLYHATDEALEDQVRSVSGLGEPQGVYYDAATNRLFAAGRQDGAVKVYDGSGFQLLATVTFSGDADNLRYDSRRGRVIVGYGDGALGFLSLDGNRSREIALDAHPESPLIMKGSSGTRLRPARAPGCTCQHGTSSLWRCPAARGSARKSSLRDEITA